MTHTGRGKAGAGGGVGGHIDQHELGDSSAVVTFVSRAMCRCVGAAILGLG